MTESADPCEYLSQIDDYAAGDVSEDVVNSLELHIYGCRFCSARLSSLLQLDATASVNELIDRVATTGTVNVIERDAAVLAVMEGVATSPSERDPAFSRWATDSGTANSGLDDSSTAMAADQMFPHRCEALSRYRPIRIAGTGGGGIVWKARDSVIGRTVAVKLLQTGQTSPTQVARFLQEANALARLSHPGIVSIYELTHYEGRPAIVMEYVSGTTLGSVLRGNPIAEEDASRLLISVVSALAHAHGQGVIHRDLKPSNLLITWPDGNTDAQRRLKDAEVKISDFGMARITDHQRMTQTGQILGTPCYMSPEQVCGDTAATDERTDIYGVGAILYELLTGRPPFTSDDPLVTMRMIQETDPVPPRMLRPKLSKEMELICLKCLSKVPKDRYATAADLLRDLQAVMAGLPICARPINVWLRSLRWLKRNRRLAVLGCVATASVIALITESLFFAWTQNRLRERAERAEKIATDRASEAEAFAAETRENADRLKRQLWNSVQDLEFLLHYLENTGALQVQDKVGAERRATIAALTLRAFEKYLGFDGPGTSLGTGDLAVAVKFVNLMQVFVPEKSNQVELDRIAACLNLASPTTRSDPWVRETEIHYYEVCAEEFANRNQPEKATSEFLKMADAVEALAAALPPNDRGVVVWFRRQSATLMKAAAIYALQQQHANAVSTIRRACAVDEKIVDAEEASDEDALQFLKHRFQLVEQLQQIDHPAAIRETDAALLYCQRYTLKDPQRADDIERQRVRFQGFLTRSETRN